MPSVSATLKMFDQMTRPLQQVTQALNLTINAMDNMSNSANRDIRITNSLNAARSAIQKANAGLNELATSQERVSNKQRKLNSSFNSGIGSISNLTSKVKGLALAYATVETMKKGMQITDNYVNQSARLSLINDELQTQEQLQEKVYQAAQRSKAAYGDTVASVAKLGLLAKDAFSSNDEVIAFSELMNKAFKISGASTSEAANGMYQLTQAMAAGRLQGDEFVSIMENAPMLAQAMAKYMNVKIGKLRELSSEGKLTSDIIKKALFSAANDINKKFSSMPQTFESVWIKIKNAALMQFSGIMQKVNELLNTPTAMAFVDGIINIIGVLAIVVGKIIELGTIVASVFEWIGQVIKNNWDFIGPIFYYIVGVILVLMLQRLWALIPVIWGLVSALAAKAGLLMINIGLWALEHFWILLIIAIIGILISIFIQCGITFEQVCGYIGHLFGGLYAIIYNIIAGLWNGFAAFAEFIASACIDPVYTIKKLFYDMCKWVLEKVRDMMQSIQDMVNSIPGVSINIVGGIEGVLNSLQVPTTDKELLKLDRMEYKDISETANKGKNIGSKIGKGISDGVSSVMNGIKGIENKSTGIPKMPSIPNASAMTPPGLDNKKGAGKNGLDKGLKGANDHLKNIDDKIDISNEHLEMMRDLAEQESIQNFVTLTPTVQVTTGDIKEEADINKIISQIETYMENELVNSAEGVYN